MLSNVVAALGVACVLAAVMVLAGWPWALLGLGVVLILSAYAMSTSSPAEVVKPAAGRVEA